MFINVELRIVVRECNVVANLIDSNLDCVFLSPSISVPYFRNISTDSFYYPKIFICNEIILKY